MVEENFSELEPSDKILIIQQSEIKGSNSRIIALWVWYGSARKMDS
jgi:hypothetical protein